MSQNTKKSSSSSSLRKDGKQLTSFNTADIASFFNVPRVPKSTDQLQNSKNEAKKDKNIPNTQKSESKESEGKRVTRSSSRSPQKHQNQEIKNPPSSEKKVKKRILVDLSSSEDDEDAFPTVSKSKNKKIRTENHSEPSSSIKSSISKDDENTSLKSSKTKNNTVSESMSKSKIHKYSKTQSEETSPSKTSKTINDDNSLTKSKVKKTDKERSSHSKSSKSKTEKISPSKIDKEETSSKYTKTKVKSEERSPSKVEKGKISKSLKNEPEKIAHSKNQKEESSSKTLKAEKLSPSKNEEASSSKSSKNTASKSSKAKVKDESSSPATPEDKKRVQSSNYFKFISRGAPKHLGSKEVPEGSANCLQGLTFVTTGVLDSFERDDIVDIVSKYGGRVTSAVSRKTNYLLVGDEPGESKIKKANELKVPRMSEDEFLELIRKSNPNASKSAPKFYGPGDDDDENSEEEVEQKIKSSPASSPSKSSPKTQKSPTKTSQIIKTEGKNLKTPEKSSKTPDKSFKSPEMTQKTPQSQLSTASSFPSTQSTQSAHENLMWVDKYKPKNLKDVIGQYGDRSNSCKLLKWLQNWFKYHGKGEDRPKASFPGFRDPEGKTFKAVLLSGPPGIGKTTTAHLCVKECGYDYFELNASDTRNKKGLHEMLADALTSTSLLNMSHTSAKHVLIMDEVDGMSGNEDRGGIQELINLLKISKVPIICICNDRNHPKIRSLANYCFDLRFNKPTNEQLKGMIMKICYREKLKLPSECVQQLISSTDQDVRQILHQLQFLSEKISSTGSENSNALFNPRKDLRFGPWDVCRKVFSLSEHRTMTLNDKSGLFFQDYNIGPLFIQENYAKWTPNAVRNDTGKKRDCKIMSLVKEAASCIATGDLVENLIRRNNNWSLLPTQALFSSLLPGELMEGEEVSGIEFPRWLGKNSTKGKNSRLLQGLYTHCHLGVSGSLEALNLDYLPYLNRSIIKPLLRGEVDESVEVMKHYNFLRDDLDYLSCLSSFSASSSSLFDKVETKIKAAFTRNVNKVLLPYSTLKVSSAKRGGGGGGGSQGDEFLDGDGEEVEEEEEEEEVGIEKDSMIKIRKGGKRKNEEGEETKAKPKKAKKSKSQK